MKPNNPSQHKKRGHTRAILRMSYGRQFFISRILPPVYWRQFLISKILPSIYRRQSLISKILPPIYWWQFPIIWTLRMKYERQFPNLGTVRINYSKQSYSQKRPFTTRILGQKQRRSKPIHLIYLLFFKKNEHSKPFQLEGVMQQPNKNSLGFV